VKRDGDWQKWTYAEYLEDIYTAAKGFIHVSNFLHIISATCSTVRYFQFGVRNWCWLEVYPWISGVGDQTMIGWDHGGALFPVTTHSASAYWDSFGQVVRLDTDYH
jgi:hypothetical protein